MITRIIRTETKYGILRRTVETDRGVRDSNDNRYNIKGIESLDSHSRSLLIADL